MKGKQMKRILSAILASIIVFSSSFTVFASNVDEIFEQISEMRDKEENKAESESTAKDTETAENENSSFINLPTFLKPSDLLYRDFNTIMDLYINNHLYDFTREELMDKFIYDLLTYHPEMYEMLISTMLGTMDPYSTYHEKGSGFLSLESDSAGYGITIDDADDKITITKVSKQSEAEKAGLLPGDVIVGIFGYDTAKLPWYVISLLLKRPYVYISEKGENKQYPDYNPEILITVERNGERLDFTLKKGLVISEELSSAYVNRDDRDIAYISVASFIGETLAQDFKKEIDRFKADGYDKLVIDLRNNGGGSLQLATEMAEIFVENGETMYYYNERRLEEPLAVISDTEKTEFSSISVLVNEHTASAAELMACILRDKAGAVLVGKKTFGKAIGQTTFIMYTGDSITLTSYEVLDQNSESYNGIGLVPELMLDNVEILAVLPELKVFNHTNYKEIAYGVYSEPCLALEQRLEVLGFLGHSVVDGIWDDYTTLAIYFLQRTYFTSGYTGGLNDKTVSLITDLINECKDDTYIEDSQLDCALLYHASLDQARRLIKEKETLAKKQAKLIEENAKKLEAELED